MPARVVVLSSFALRVAIKYEEPQLLRCMKTRCALQEHPSENVEVEVYFFPYAELTFHDCFSCRNDNSELIKVLHTINLP